MAQLKDSIVSGNLRVTDTTLTDTLQTTTIRAPSTSGGTTYGPGTNGQVLKSNGTTTYWASDSNTDEKVKSTKLAQSTAAATYYPTLMTGAATAGVDIFESMKFLHTPGTTSAVGNSRLVLGNATASGTANNEEGLVRLYSPGTAYHTIKGASTSSNVDHTLPATSGTVLNTGTTSVTAVYGSTGTHIATVKVNGSDTKIYAPTPQTPTTYSAGTGLSLSGTTFNHSNSVTAGTAKGDDSKTLTFGGTFTIPSVTYDAQGHITAKGTTTMTMPSNPNTDTKVNVTLGKTTIAYLLGTTTTPTNTAQAVTSIADTGVYLGTTAGSLYATSFYENGTALSSKYAALSHSHDNLTSKTLTASTFDSTSGNFFFKGGSLFGGTDNADWVGIQSDATNDKFQLVAGGNNGVFFRESDDTWGQWHSLLTNNMITGSSGITVTPKTITIGGDDGTTINAGLGISHSNSVTAVTSNAFKKVAYDANGHITGSSDVAKSDITALGIPGQDTKYGLSGAYGSNSNTWVTTLTAGGSGTTSTVPTASTSVYGITKLYNGVDSTSTGLAATANAVKTAYDKGNHSHPYLPLSGGTLTGTVTLGSTTSSINAFKQPTRNESNYARFAIWSYGDTWGTYGAEIGYWNQYNGTTPGTKGSITILPYQTTSNPWDGQVGLHITKDHGYIDGNEILVHKDVTSSTLNSSSGSFSFSGSGDPWGSSDWVGLQIGDNVDKFQLTMNSGNLLVRQNDNGGTSSTGWTEWKTLSDTTHTHSEYVPFSGGTMDSNVSLSFPKSDGDGRYTSINTNGIDCHGTANFGWAMGLRYYVGETSQNMDFGGYGSDGEFKYLYIGTWDNPIVKITPDKVSEFSGNVVLHSASGNSPSLTFQHGTTIDSLLDWRMMAVGSDLKLYSSTSGSTESWSNILTFGGGGITINKKIGGLWVTDYKGTSYPMMRDNGENLWIGTMSTTSYHHNGGTYISTGWDHYGSLPTTANETLHGNETIKICVPRYSTNDGWNGVNYNAIHDGPQLTNTRYLVNSSSAIPSIHRAMFPNIRSNKLSFVSASNVVVEYSTNNGSTWVNMSTTVSGTNNAISDAMKAQLTTGRWDCNIPIGPNNTSVARTTSMQTRITLTLTDRDCMIDQIYMQLNPGYHSFQYTIQYATTTSPSDSDWIDWKKDFAVSTWMYEDTVNGKPIRIGNTAKKLRFIFKQATVNAAYNKNLSTIKDIAAYGGQGSWTSPNEMFRYDHMYSWDYNKNVDFPADVSGNSLTSPTVNVSSGASYKASINASGLTQNRTITIGDVSGNVGIVKVLHDNSSYAAGQSVSITTSETFKYFIVTIKPNNTFGEKTEIIRITNDTTVSTKYISFTGDIGPAPSQPTITLGGYITHQYNTTNKTYTIGAGHAANYILCNNNLSSVNADSITLAITKIVGLA